jgi:hypothetical protein
MNHLNGSTNGHAVDEAVDLLYAFWPGATPAPQPCPEAAFSLTLQGTIGGHEALLTARGQTAAEFKRNLEAITGLLDPVAAIAVTPPQASSPPQGQLSPQQHNAAAMHRPITGFCPVHNVAMKLNQKDGRQWWSHYDETAGRWCKGKLCRESGK